MEHSVTDFRISLAAARVNADLTQREVAEKLGVSNKTIVNWENGKSAPTFPMLVAMSNLYNVPLDFLRPERPLKGGNRRKN